MPSMMPMMSTMRLAEALIRPMLTPTWATASPPWCAMSAAATTSCSASSALSVFWRTAWASCAMFAALCSRLAAWASVRRARSALPSAMSRLAVSIEVVAPFTSPMMARRFTFTWHRPRSSWPMSPLASCAQPADRSPPANARAAAMAWRSGSTTARRSDHQFARVAASAARHSASGQPWPAVAALAASSSATLPMPASRRVPTCASRHWRRRARHPVRTAAPPDKASAPALPSRKRRYSAAAASTWAREGRVRTDI